MTGLPVVAAYQRRQNKGVLTLCGVVDIFEAAGLQAAALRAVKDDKAAVIHVNLAQTERLDMSAMQILAALRRDVEASGRVLHVEAMPPALQATLTRLGLETGQHSKRN